MSLEWKHHCEKNPDINPKDKQAIKNYYKYNYKTPLNEDGSINYVTQQMNKDECDINLIIKRYPIRVTQARMAMAEAKFADVSGMDFQKSINLVMDTTREFMKLDPEIRSKFDNDPAKYLDFLARPTAAADQIKEIVEEEPKRTKGKKQTDQKIEEILKEDDND